MSVIIAHNRFKRAATVDQVKSALSILALSEEDSAILKARGETGLIAGLNLMLERAVHNSNKFKG